VRVTVNEDKDRYETQLLYRSRRWKHASTTSHLGAQRPVTALVTEQSRVAFVRTPEPVDGKSKPSQIYLISMDGGEARPLTDAAKARRHPCGPPDWSHDRLSLDSGYFRDESRFCKEVC